MPHLYIIRLIRNYATVIKKKPTKPFEMLNVLQLKFEWKLGKKTYYGSDFEQLWDILPINLK